MLIEQKGESFVLAGDQPAKLRYPRVDGELVLYKYDDEHNKILYERGKDFIVTNEGIVRVSDRVPDYRNSPFYAKAAFNHERMATFGNDPFMVYADYTAETTLEETVEYNAIKTAEESGNLASLRKFFDEFKKPTLNLLIFGDSISEGGGTTDIKYAYFSRFKEYLECNYSFKVDLTNKAIGGESSFDGLRRYKDVISADYDLMILAYGMNDQVVDGNGNQWCSPQNLHDNLEMMAEYAKFLGVKPVLVSPCISNPRWIHSSKILDQFTKQIEYLSKEKKIPYADVYHLWKKELNYKTHSDLLQNDINHPSDFGHYIYFSELKALL